MPGKLWGFVTLLAFCGWAGAGAPGSTKSFELQQGQSVIHTLIFQDGAKATIKIVSDKDTDVDLYVRDSQNKLVARDTSPGKDCDVSFMPAQTQLYQVLVMNIGPGANRCKMIHNGTEAAFRTEELPEFSLKEDERKSFNVKFLAGKLAAIWVTSVKKTDVDLLVYDKDNRVVASDVRISKDCFVSWVPRDSQEYRVEVVNMGPGPNTCVVKHGTHSNERR